MDIEYFKFCPRLRRMIESRRSIDWKGEEVSVSGLSTLNNLRVLREIILEKGYSKTLEIGLAYGASTLTILHSLKAASPAGFHHTAIDPFESLHYGGSALKTVEEEGFQPNFTHFDEPSSLVLPEMVRRNEQYQLIYIDGSHLFEDVFVDVYFSIKLLEPGGALLLDDCSDSHVRKVIRFLDRNYGKAFEALDLGLYDDPGKSLKKRIGNMLGVRQLRGYRKVSKPERDWDMPLKDF